MNYKKTFMIFVMMAFLFLVTIILVKDYATAQQSPQCPVSKEIPVSATGGGVETMSILVNGVPTHIRSYLTAEGIAKKMAIKDCNGKLEEEIVIKVAECRRYCRRQNPSCNSFPTVNFNSCDRIKPSCIQGDPNILPLNSVMGQYLPGLSGVINLAFCTATQKSKLNCVCE